MPGVPGELSRSRSMHPVKIDPDQAFVNCEKVVDACMGDALAYSSSCEDKQRLLLGLITRGRKAPRVRLPSLATECSDDVAPLIIV